MKRSNQEFPTHLLLAIFTIPFIFFLISGDINAVPSSTNIFFFSEPGKSKLNVDHANDTFMNDADESIQRPDNNSPDFWRSLINGNITFNNRFRTELVTADGLDNARAITNRLQVGYGTSPWYGFSVFTDFVDVRPIGVEKYNAAGLNDQPDRAIVADPRFEGKGTMADVSKFWLQAEIGF